MKAPSLYERRSAEVQLEQARRAFIAARTAYQRAKARAGLARIDPGQVSATASARGAGR